MGNPRLPVYKRKRNKKIKLYAPKINLNEIEKTMAAKYAYRKELYKDDKYIDYKQIKGYSRKRIENKQNYHYIKKYGVNYKWYTATLELQDFKCKICGKKHLEDNKKLYVDHNHATNEVRGLLCMDCNLALGFFKDNENNLLRAIQYLKRC